MCARPSGSARTPNHPPQRRACAVTSAARAAAPINNRWPTTWRATNRGHPYENPTHAVLWRRRRPRAARTELQADLGGRDDRRPARGAGARAPTRLNRRRYVRRRRREREPKNRRSVANGIPPGLPGKGNRGGAGLPAPPGREPHPAARGRRDLDASGAAQARGRQQAPAHADAARAVAAAKEATARQARSRAPTPAESRHQ